ncbi:hypothetical protein [Paenibacillus sp. RUD330]|uniref:hypothetical protein n=1 Tax=Paenibacillus sp. RUD330 TaxID=2023772 RepID=UPI001F0DE63C|nr:hypothetical protein [Paenibacillus sp. RUD330]
MIDPSFWEDEKLGELSPSVRLLFMGLISQADDEGRLKGHPGLVKSLIYPYDMDITPQSVDEWLNQLASRKMILRYEVDSQKYILLNNFKKHQTINRPQESKLPAPLTDHSVNDHGQVSEPSPTDHAQYNLKEFNLREGEVKGSETHTHAIDTNPHKDRLQKLCMEMNISGLNLYILDVVFSYIGMADLEVIEACIKKSQDKPHSYLTKTLQGMIVKDQITRKEQLYPQKDGERNAEHERGPKGIRHGVHSQEGGRVPAESKVSRIYPGKWDDSDIPLPGMSG